jgi:membrane protein YqaA with SNARE-associated domain
MEILEHATAASSRSWQWFVEHAKSRFALLWLSLIAFTDTVFSPITAEAFMAVLLLAHRERWRTYLAVSLASSTAGAIAGYWIFFYLFRTFGESFIASWNLGEAYALGQAIIGSQIFVTMLIASFTPLPDKAFIYAAGIFGAPFLPFVIGFVIGRGLRMSVVTYLVWRFGPLMLASFEKYSTYAAIVSVAILAIIYGMVHWHLLPL